MMINRDDYKLKRANSSDGSIEIENPQDRKTTFRPQVAKNDRKDFRYR